MVNSVASITSGSSISPCQFYVYSASSSAHATVFRESSVTPPIPLSCIDAKQDPITECTAGMGVDGIVNCMPCAPGRSSSGGASASCTQCNRGNIAPLHQSAVCSACDAGKTSAISSTSIPALSAAYDGTRRHSVEGDIGGTICVNCGPGRRQNLQGRRCANLVV